MPRSLLPRPNITQGLKNAKLVNLEYVYCLDLKKKKKKKKPKCFLPIRYCSLARTFKILCPFVCLEWSKRHCQNSAVGTAFFCRCIIFITVCAFYVQKNIHSKGKREIKACCCCFRVFRMLENIRWNGIWKWVMDGY